MAEQNFNLTMSKTELKDMDNTEFVEAIRAMRADFNAESQNKVVNLALHATFLVPAITEKKTELVKGADDRMKFEDKPTIKFLLISNPERGTFFPVYTDMELLKGFKTDRKFQAVAMKFSDIANLTEQTPTVNGFIVNPDTEKLPFTKEILNGIKQSIITAREKAKARKAEGGPNITVSTNENPET